MLHETKQADEQACDTAPGDLGGSSNDGAACFVGGKVGTTHDDDGAAGRVASATATVTNGADARTPRTALPFLPASGLSGADVASAAEVEASRADAIAGPHAAEGKAARIKQLFAEGKDEQAMILVNAALRGTARRRERRAEKAAKRTGKPRDPFYFMKPDHREQWSGQDIHAICQTIAKGVHKGDTSGTAVFDAWRRLVAGILAQEPDHARVAERVALAIRTKEVTRNDANRRSLCDGLTELQVQVAALIGVDPRDWVRPVHASATAPADHCAEEASRPDTPTATVDAGEDGAREMNHDWTLVIHDWDDPDSVGDFNAACRESGFDPDEPVGQKFGDARPAEMFVHHRCIRCGLNLVCEEEEIPSRLLRDQYRACSPRHVSQPPSAGEVDALLDRMPRGGEEGSANG